jgi:hypothetical protein
MSYMWPENDHASEELKRAEKTNPAPLKEEVGIDESHQTPLGIRNPRDITLAFQIQSLK